MLRLIIVLFIIHHNSYASSMLSEAGKLRLELEYIYKSFLKSVESQNINKLEFIEWNKSICDDHIYKMNNIRVGYHEKDMYYEILEKNKNIKVNILLLLFFIFPIHLLLQSKKWKLLFIIYFPLFAIVYFTQHIKVSPKTNTYDDFVFSNKYKVINLHKPNIIFGYEKPNLRKNFEHKVIIFMDGKVKFCKIDEFNEIISNSKKA